MAGFVLIVFIQAVFFVFFIFREFKGFLSFSIAESYIYKINIK